MSRKLVAEFLGTFLLVLLICLAASLFVQVPTPAQPAKPKPAPTGR